LKPARDLHTRGNWFFSDMRWYDFLSAGGCCTIKMSATSCIRTQHTCTTGYHFPRKSSNGAKKRANCVFSFIPNAQIWSTHCNGENLCVCGGKRWVIFGHMQLHNIFANPPTAFRDMIAVNSVALQYAQSSKSGKKIACTVINMSLWCRLLIVSVWVRYEFDKIVQLKDYAPDKKSTHLSHSNNQFDATT
jgi:hypothetical protein